MSIGTHLGMLGQVAMASKGILVVGSVNMDMVVKTGAFPRPGETVFGGSFGMFPGGKGANQAVCAAKLGGKVTFVGKLGKDIFSRKLMESMRRDGVILRHVLTDQRAPTGTALITVDRSGENEIVVVSGSNMKLSAADLRAKNGLFRSAGVLLLQLEIPLPTVVFAARRARSHGTIVILNPAPAAKLPADLLRVVDYLTPNETELAALTGRPTRSMKEIVSAAQLLLRRGVRNVVVTLGSRGALLVNNGTGKLYPALKVKAVDTTAAGDAFNGALAYSLAAGKTLDAAMQFANAVAAFSVGRMGAQGSMPTKTEMATFQL